MTASLSISSTLSLGRTIVSSSCSSFAVWRDIARYNERLSWPLYRRSRPGFASQLGDLENIARQRPWVVVAGGVALGFAASRFLRASSGERYSSRSEPTYRGSSYDAPVTRTAVVDSGTVTVERSEVWDEERIGDIGTGRQAPGVSADL